MRNAIIIFGFVCILFNAAAQNSGEYIIHHSKEEALKAAGLEKFATKENDKIINQANAELALLKKISATTMAARGLNMTQTMLHT